MSLKISPEVSLKVSAKLSLKAPLKVCLKESIRYLVWYRPDPSSLTIGLILKGDVVLTSYVLENSGVRGAP